MKSPWNIQSEKVIKDFDPSKAPRVDGKIIVITGANSGIGYFNALDLARKGAQVVLACRNEERGKATEAKINESIAGVENAGKAVFMKLDTSSLASVEAFSEELHKKFDRVNILINNAGIMAPPFAKSVDGFESQFATNHLGHFALTGQILDLLKKGAPSRIVNVSSVAHRQAKWNVDDISPQEKNYSSLTVYSNTKFFNLVFTYELERRLRANKIDGVIAVASHPGYSATNLVDSSVRDRNIFMRFTKCVYDLLPLGQRPEEGSLPTLYAALVENVEGAEYYGPKDGKQNFSGKPCLQKSIDLSYDEEVGKKLWQVSEELSKVNFKF